jgi:uncharacterized membrane protein YdbT with pleckstrin-like domain
MAGREFYPNQRLLYKMFLVFSLLAVGIFLAALLFGFLIGLDDPQAGLIISTLFSVPTFLFWVIAMALTVPYFRSLRYEILDEEVIVHVGVITHSVKHVPFRTVTNITVKRDIFDRWFFNLGSLYIQTAGMSGKSGVEEKLEGIENVQEVYDIVATALRRYRGAMSPTAAGEEEALEVPGDGALLEEVRAIRRILEAGEE